LSNDLPASRIVIRKSFLEHADKPTRSTAAQRYAKRFSARFLLEDTGSFIVLLHLACSKASSPIANDLHTGEEHFLSPDTYATHESTLIRNGPGSHPDLLNQSIRSSMARFGHKFASEKCG
jgi:hypothetical protein